MEEALARLIEELVQARETATPDAASTRGRITHAALELFAERSYEAATTKAIADRAGVTERTLFKHFPSKEDLFARTVFPALLRVLQPLTIQSLKDVLTGHHGDFRATLRALVAERITFASRHPALVRMFARELLQRPAFRTALADFFQAQIYPTLLEVFASAHAQGQLRDLPPDAVMRTIMAQVGAFALQRVLLAPSTQPISDAEVDGVVDLILHGLAPAPTH